MNCSVQRSPEHPAVPVRDPPNMRRSITRFRQHAIMSVKVLSLVVLAFTTTLTGFPSQSTVAVGLTLDTLTVIKGLPAGCSLATDKPVIGLNLPVQIDSNPWRGTDRSILASIREVMYGSPRLPDGPPLSAAELSRFLFRLSHGIDEGYVALYQQQGSEDLEVRALTFSKGEPFPRHGNMARIDSRRVVWLESGRTAIVLYGDESPCFSAIQSHLRSLTNR